MSDRPHYLVGAGLDLTPARTGLISVSSNDIAIEQPLKLFLAQWSPKFDYIFFSFRAYHSHVLLTPELIKKYREFFSELKDHLCASDMAIVIHPTLFDIGSDEERDWDLILDFFGEVLSPIKPEKINLDVGIWSAGGVTLTHPLPPLFTERGLETCIENVVRVKQGLGIPVAVEFPSFGGGMGLILGDMDPLEFTGRLVSETDSQLTLDVGHLMSYAFKALLTSQELVAQIYSKLPMETCTELHLAGYEIRSDVFFDSHNGRLSREQMDLATQIATRYSSVGRVLFEDPEFDIHGMLSAESLDSYQLLMEAFGHRAKSEKI